MENYEEKYKTALANAEFYHKETANTEVKNWLEYTFPELRESKDDRIKRCIQVALTDVDEKRYKDYGTTLIECLDWLEKQGEQKPAWSEEDEKMLESAIWHVSYSASNGKSTDYQCQVTDWLKSIKPIHWKPSEQNIKDLEWCADLVKDKMGVGFHRLQVFIDELKNL